MHPWENFAETFAHYLHIIDTLTTAASGAMVLEASRLEGLIDHDVVPLPSYMDHEIDDVLADRRWLSMSFNAVNHAMGKGDLYPFRIVAPVRRKLVFVHDVVRQTASTPERGHPLPSRPRTRICAWTRMILRPHLAFGGLAVGTVFLWLSRTPSLLPRSWPTQGIVSGLAFISGYGVGSAVSAEVRTRLHVEPAPERNRLAWRLLGAIGAVGTLMFLLWSRTWQDELCELVGMEPSSALTRLQVLVVAAFVAGLVLVISRIVRSATRFSIRQLDRVTPRAISITLGTALVVVLVVGFAQGVLWRAVVSSMESAFSTFDSSTAEGAEQPSSSLRSGGPDSLVEWDQLGRQGRNFTGRGPDVEQLEQVGRRFGQYCRGVAVTQVVEG